MATRCRQLQIEEGECVAGRRNGSHCVSTSNLWVFLHTEAIESLWRLIYMSALRAVQTAGVGLSKCVLKGMSICYGLSEESLL